MKDIGFNTQNKGDRNKIEITDEMKDWYKNPVWLQTFFIGAIFAGFVLMNWPLLSNNLATFIVDVTSFRLVDLFAVTAIVALLFMAYFFMATMWTGAITNKLVYAKLFKKRTMWHLGEDNVLHLYLPDTSKKGWWIVKGVGEFKVVKDAMFWLVNGSLSMLTVFGFSEGVNLGDAKDRSILKIDPKNFENRNKEARLEGIEAAANPLNQLNLAVLIPLILIIGVASYLIIGQMQTSDCQSELVKLAQTCGQVAKQATEAASPRDVADNILTGVTGK
jgi:hypothetical protein